MSKITSHICDYCHSNCGTHEDGYRDNTCQECRNRYFYCYPRSEFPEHWKKNSNYQYLCSYCCHHFNKYENRENTHQERFRKNEKRKQIINQKNRELKKRGYEVCVRCVQWDDNSQIENPNEVIKKIGEERCSICLKSWVKGLEANQERLEKANDKTLKDLYNLNVKMISEGKKVDLDELAKVFDEEIVQSLREYQAEVKRSKEEVNQSPTNPNSNNSPPQPTNYSPSSFFPSSVPTSNNYSPPTSNSTSTSTNCSECKKTISAGDNFYVYPHLPDKKYCEVCKTQQELALPYLQRIMNGEDVLTQIENDKRLNANTKISLLAFQCIKYGERVDINSIPTISEESKQELRDFQAEIDKNPSIITVPKPKQGGKYGSVCLDCRQNWNHKTIPSCCPNCKSKKIKVCDELGNSQELKNYDELNRTLFWASLFWVAVIGLIIWLVVRWRKKKAKKLLENAK